MPSDKCSRHVHIRLAHCAASSTAGATVTGCFTVLTIDLWRGARPQATCSESHGWPQQHPLLNVLCSCIQRQCSIIGMPGSMHAEQKPAWCCYLLQRAPLPLDSAAVLHSMWYFSSAPADSQVQTIHRSKTTQKYSRTLTPINSSNMGVQNC